MLPLSFETQVREFIRAGHEVVGRSAWIEHEDIKVYLRSINQFYKTPDLDGYYPTVVIANVAVYPIRRHQGLYNALLNVVMEEAIKRNSVCYIENVQERDHEPIYLRRGFNYIPLPPSIICRTNVPCSFYKVPLCPNDSPKIEKP